ncbi:MAG: selenocysteine-specific translation elongation factor [Planctomycetes bacterium]|nr:selenocysteine-specific translation elongation factor [Planctomycetota bacterium]
MPSEQINLTIGTAGHIDHGKTALVKCLTGCDTDRLKVEKERGMSIDLGFAPCTIADMEVGIVDVPGHENFIKTMVAGAAGMDAVLLVVAADDGVMPQTREHLDILTLLGVEHGLVALTKVDRVDSESLEMAIAELGEYLQGTFLEGAPVLPVSSVTGQGFDGFFEALVSLMEFVEPKPLDGVFRLPLDRAFSVKGYGTVVSGIPVCGSAHLDDEVELLPQGATGRVRGIEVYGRTSDTVKAGQCAALNVRQLDQHSISRGDTLTLPGYFSAGKWFVCTLQLLPLEKVALKNGANVKLHVGTAEVGAAVYAMKGDAIRPGEEYLVQIRTNTPVVAGPGDRYILRTLSPVRTVGGGMIVEGIPGKLKRKRPNLYEELHERAQAVSDDRRFVEYCVRTARTLAASVTDLAVRTKLLRDHVKEILRDLTDQNRVFALKPGLYMHCDAAADARGHVLEMVGDYHRRSPESLGITLEQLRADSHMDNNVLDGVIDLLKSEGRLVDRSGRVAAAEHKPSFQGEDQKHIETIESLYRDQPFRPPSADELVEKTGTTPATVKKILKILREHDKLVQVEEGMVFHSEAVDRAREILIDHIKSEGKLESVRFKYLLDTTRKYAIPLLDYFDRVGLLRRDGNTRYLKKPVP